MNTNTLTGADLNCAVAMALGREVIYNHQLADEVLAHDPRMTDWRDQMKQMPKFWVIRERIQDEESYPQVPDYSGDKALAGLLIEEHRISVFAHGHQTTWHAYIYNRRGMLVAQGRDTSSHATAAMRCFVASVFGSNVELP